MTNKKKHDFPFRSSREELEAIRERAGATYELAFADQEFLLREELRPVRLQLELLKPELELLDNNIEETIVFFGSARIPNPDKAKAALEKAQADLARAPEDGDRKRQVKIAENVMHNSSYLEQATKLAEIVSKADEPNYYVVTGGGPSFMAAANKGAQNADKSSVSLGVVLPHEQVPNEFVTPGLTFQFHYFAIRKMHFMMRAKALVAFPGGFGTCDELFEALTLIQTKKIAHIPLILFNKRFWQNIINFEAFVEEGTISAKDLNLIHFVDTAEEAWGYIQSFYNGESSQ